MVSINEIYSEVLQIKKDVSELKESETDRQVRNACIFAAVCTLLFLTVGLALPLAVIYWI